MFLSSSKPQAACSEALLQQGCFAAEMLQQGRNVRSSRTCQRGDWMRRVRRVQAVPGQAGWLAPGTQAPQPQSLGDYSLLDGPGGPGLRLQTGLSSGCCTCHVPSRPSAAVFAGRTRVLQPVQDRIVLEMSWSEKQRMMYLFLGCGEEHLQSFAVLRRMG